LTDKRGFQEAEADRVWLETSMKQADDSYKNNIKVEPVDSNIVVKNFNYFEIRNYVLKLPSTIPVERLLTAKLAQLIVPEPASTGLSSDGITITIRPLGPAQAGKPGTMLIPIQ